MKGRLVKEEEGIFHLHLDYAKVKSLIGINHNRVKCAYKDETWYSTIINTSESEAYIIILSELDELKNLGLDNQMEVHLESDHRVYKCSVPEELVEEMHGNPKANDRFHRLSESLQRSIIYKIKSIIEPTERRKRARTALMSLV